MKCVYSVFCVFKKPLDSYFNQIKKLQSNCQFYLVGTYSKTLKKSGNTVKNTIVTTGFLFLDQTSQTIHIISSKRYLCKYMFNILPIILNFIQTRKFILHYGVSEFVLPIYTFKQYMICWELFSFNLVLDFGLVLDRIFMSKVQDQVNRIVLNTKQVHVICTKYMQQVDKCMIMQYFYSLDFTFPSLQHLTKVLLKQFLIQILGCT